MLTLIGSLLLAALVVLIGIAAFGLAVMVLAPGRVAVASGPSTGAERPASTDRARAVLVAAIGLAFALIAVAVVLRALVAGHAPWSNLHEFSVAFAAFLLGAFLVLLRTAPVAGLTPLVAALAAGLLGVALQLPDDVDPLVPALQQPLLLTVHVGTAALAYALAGLAFVAAAAELAQRAAGDRIGLLPSATVGREVAHRAVLAAFPMLTVAITLGSVWANLAWRSYWSNDPKELAAAATWLVFGAYLHVVGRRDHWAALGPWLIVLGFVGVLFTYIGAGLLIVGEHSYGVP